MSSPAAQVEEVLDLGGPQLRARMARIETRLGEIAASASAPLDGWASTTIAAGGKRLRPLLVLLAAGPGVADDTGLIRAGVAVELVHSATLVHDDVLDAASLRRGAPTVWATAGREAAIATGDFLFAKAFSELLDPTHPRNADAVRVLSDASGALAQGELLQREDAFGADVALERYLHRCALKTARLFRAACELGAMEADEDRVALGAFGERIGLAFQLLDDVLDVSGPAERTGKHRGTDLLDGTVTLPLILAREREPSLRGALPTTPEEAEALCDRIAATGALDEARARALAIVEEAKAELPRDDPALRLVADGVVARYA